MSEPPSLMLIGKLIDCIGMSYGTMNQIILSGAGSFLKRQNTSLVHHLHTE